MVEEEKALSGVMEVGGSYELRKKKRRSRTVTRYLKTFETLKSNFTWISLFLLNLSMLYSICPDSSI